MHVTNVVMFPPRVAAAPPRAQAAATTAEPGLAPLAEDFDAEALAIALIAAARQSFGPQYGAMRLQLVPELRRIAELVVALRQAGFTVPLARRLLRAQVDAAAGWLCLAHAVRPQATAASIMQALLTLEHPVNQALGGRVLVAPGKKSA
jgi:hypothetical protein